MKDWWNQWAGVALLAPFLVFGAVMKIREWRQRRQSAARLAAALETASKAGAGVHHGPGWVVHKDTQGSRIEYDPRR
jgi:hypothetical protein